MSQEPESQESLADQKPTKTSCEVKLKFEVEVDGVKRKESQWKLRKVSSLKGKPVDIRCPYCHGPILLAFEGTGARTADDHFEHLGKKVGTTDRITCKAGEAFKGGENQMSIKLIE